MDDIAKKLAALNGLTQDDIGAPTDDKLSQDELLALIVDAQYQIALMQIGETPDE